MKALTGSRIRSRQRRAFAALLGAVLPLLAATFLSATTAAPASASAAELTEITDFGENPSNLRMHLYVPDSVTEQPAVLLALHYCTGTGEAYYAGTQFASLADQYGFIVIYPTATRSSQCWDVSSQQALTRDGGSDPVGLKSMIDYTVETHGADTSRLFVSGGSSGAMMTNVMLGNYPDVFAAGSALAGVPFGCFATTDGSEWNSACAGGQITHTPQEWGDLVRAAYPGYEGPYPRMQVFHGTVDDILNYTNFQEEIKQWTNVHGLSQTPEYTDNPTPEWTRTRYGGTGTQVMVEANSFEGYGHGLPGGLEQQVIEFLGLNSAP
ncbi:extracellular catalytic domain type 1 short-chain-length polyhydroxyalkanoate depolymerase [Streptomyces sp. 6N223]|uniref:extracellular catalytic domain type 1 short-chain-length polyhydroxyalkanoate depolymerase n=1 Tax=Streptomyces sp. 6N223 TaxID=3457412 RepID=UPI003FD335D9